MSFFRHREILRFDVMRWIREQRNRRSPAHRLDEFPVGYSSASCTPAALASASPTGIHSATQARCRHRGFQPTANSVLTFCATSGDNRRLSAGLRLSQARSVDLAAYPFLVIEQAKRQSFFCWRTSQLLTRVQPVHKFLALELH